MEKSTVEPRTKVFFASTKDNSEQSRNHFQTLFNLMVDPVVIIDAKGRFLEITDRVEEITGYKKEELLGRNFFRTKIVTARSKAILAKDLAKRMMGRHIAPYEIEVVTKEERKLPYEINAAKIEYKGKPADMLVFRDLSERKKISKKLRESEEKFRNLYECIPGSLAVYVGKEGHLIEYNEAFREWTGYTDEELKDKTYLDFVHPDEQVLAQKNYHTKRLEEKYPLVYETKLVAKDGNIVPTQLSASPYKKEGRIIGTVVVNVDITKRKQAEQKLKESEERFRSLYQNIQDPIGVFVGREGWLIDYNKAFKKLCGYTDEELKNKIFLEFVHPDDQTLVLEKYRTEYSEEKLPLVYEIRGVNKKGEAIHLEISVSTYKKENRVIGILVIHRDISERKRIQEERKKMEEKLRVVGGLTRHDIRNKLSSVMGNIYLAKKQLNHNDKACEYLERVGSAARQVEGILNFARNYEKLGMEKLALLDLEKTVEEAILLLPNLQSVKVLNGCRGLTVLADSLLRQLFYNLIDNSLRHGKTVSQIRIYYEEMENNKLKLVYEDDGVGISAAEKKKIFMEGYGKGTGYGLYLIKKICEVYGWTIRETGKQGEGAQFTIIISRAGESE